MRLLDRVLKREVLNLGNGNTGIADWVYTSYGTPNRERMAASFSSFVLQAFQGDPVVFALVVARLTLLSEATFKWRKLSDKSLFGNTDLSLLETPWPNGTAGELLGRMELDDCLAGNAFIRSNGVRLEHFRPDCVTIVSELVRDHTGNQIRQLVGYWYDPSAFDSEREAALYPVSEVAHWAPVPDPLAEFRGMSWLTPVIREINADAGMTSYKTQYLNNAATPNMVITYDRELSDEAAKKVGAAVQAKHGGVANAFGTLILDKGADATVIGADFSKMDFTKVQAAGENRIAAAARVPAIVAGLKEGLDAATYSNYGMAMRAFADLWARPTWRSACAALQSIVTVPAGAQLWYDTSDIAALLEGEQERAETFQTKAVSAQTLINAGYEPETVAAAIDSGDLTQLKHTGRIPTQLYNTDDPVDPAYGPKAKITEPVTEAPPLVDPNVTETPPVKAAP